MPCIEFFFMHLLMNRKLDSQQRLLDQKAHSLKCCGINVWHASRKILFAKCWLQHGLHSVIYIFNGSKLTHSLKCSTVHVKWWAQSTVGSSGGLGDQSYHNNNNSLLAMLFRNSQQSLSKQTISRPRAAMISLVASLILVSSICVCGQLK